MKVKSQGKTGVSGVNHDETLVRVQKPTTGLKVKTHVKAAGQLIVGLKEGMSIQ
jgi:hypothetical protein